MPQPFYLPKKPAPKPGRPTLLNPTRQAVLLKAIEQGMPLKQAAEVAGMSYDTLNHWQKKGESDTAPPEYRQFCQLLRHSQAIAMQVHVSAIHKAAERDWRAAAWMLERRFPTDFARPQQIEHSAPGGKPLISSTGEDHEVLRRIRKQEGIKNLTIKFAEILARNRRQTEESVGVKEEAKMLQLPFILGNKEAHES